jgi:hypothetical protein
VDSGLSRRSGQFGAVSGPKSTVVLRASVRRHRRIFRCCLWPSGRWIDSNAAGPFRSRCMAAVWVADDQALDGIPAQGPAATARESRRRRLGGTLTESVRQDRNHVLTERRAALFPALILAADVRTGETYAELGIRAKSVRENSALALEWGGGQWPRARTRLARGTRICFESVQWALRDLVLLESETNLM